MKNLVFILFIVSLFITSCTKDFTEPVTPGIPDTETTISDRNEDASTIEVSCTVSSYEAGINGNSMVLTNFSEDVSELTIQSNQTLKVAVGGIVVDYPVEVASFDVIGEDGDLYFVIPNTNLIFQSTQVLKFSN